MNILSLRKFDGPSKGFQLTLQLGYNLSSPQAAAETVSFLLEKDGWNQALAEEAMQVCVAALRAVGFVSWQRLKDLHLATWQTRGLLESEVEANKSIPRHC